MGALQQALLMYGASASAGNCNPSDFAGATGKFDATSASLPGLTDGGAVGSSTDWLDQLSLRKFTQGTSADRPILHTTGGPNSQPYVQFADSSDIVNFSNTLSTVFNVGSYTVFVVVRPQRNGISGGPSGVPVVFGGGGQWGILLGASGANNKFTLFQRSGGVNTFLNSTTTYSQNVWYIVECWYDGTNINIKVNNDTAATVAKGNPSFANTPNIGQNGLTSDVAGLYLWNVDIGSGSRDVFRACLGARFSITLP